MTDTTHTTHITSLLDRIEADARDELAEQTRVLSAAAWTPEPRRGPWARLGAWLLRRLA